MKLVILSPHLDDAVLSCWQLLDGPDEVFVVNVFTASPPAGTPPPWWDRATGATDPVERMRERREEDAAALALAGRASVHLGLLDDQYRDFERSSQAVAGCIREAVDQDAVLYAPGGLDGHPDHVLVRDVALAFARTGPEVVIYADLPHAIVRGWPTWVSGERDAAGAEIAADWSRALAGAGLAPERLIRWVHPLVAEARARKLRALAAYRTQRAELDRFGFAPLADPRVLAWEVTWQVPVSALSDMGELAGETRVDDPIGQAIDDRA